MELEGLTLANLIAKWAAILAVFAYAWNVARKVPSKEEIDKRIDSKVSRSEFDARIAALESDIKEIKETQIRSEEHNRADFRELRELIRESQSKDKIS